MPVPLALPRHVPLVVATRGEHVESVHYGSIAVVDAGGRVLAHVGDIDTPQFTRSTLKPFQALPFVTGGGPAFFGFTAAHLALMCASHSGEARHLAIVTDMLAHAGCGEAQLQCGCHVPLFYEAAGVPAPPDLAASPLHHNCSGKHAGFLAWCRQHKQPLDTYLDPEHPLQREIRRCLVSLVACGENDMPHGIDGCGAPNYALPLARLAQAYARLAASAAGDELGASLSSLFQAMTTHPELVSGEGRGDLRLMRAGGGDWVAKGGAEGVQALGIASRGLGIALKIADGNSRAVPVVLGAVLEQLELRPADFDALPKPAQEIRNHAGRLTGRLLPVFTLA